MAGSQGALMLCPRNKFQKSSIVRQMRGVAKREQCPLAGSDATSENAQASEHQHRSNHLLRSPLIRGTHGSILCFRKLTGPQEPRQVKTSSLAGKLRSQKRQRTSKGDSVTTTKSVVTVSWLVTQLLLGQRAMEVKRSGIGTGALLITT